jgi:transposase
MAERALWCKRIAQVDPRRILFLDETGAKTNMTRLYGRTRGGARVKDYAPHGHWNTTTLVAVVGWTGPSAPMVLDGPMDSEAFEAYVAQILQPVLRQGMIVVMDNLSSHKTSKITSLIEEAGAELWYLPPYSPDFNPIELMWSKVKTYLRAVKARTKEALWEATAHALDTITPGDTAGWFKHCGVCIIN